MNILDHVAITVPCGVCGGQYSVPASVVLEGQKAISHGCPGCSDYECEARYVAGMVDRRALLELQAAWHGSRQAPPRAAAFASRWSRPRSPRHPPSTRHASGSCA